MLSSRDQRIVALRLAGTILNEIAEQVGCHRNTVRRVLAKPEAQAVFAQASPQVEQTIAAGTAQAVLSLQQQFDNVAQDAFDKLTELMQAAESEGIQLKSAESILDRSGVSPKRQIHSQHTEDKSIHISFSVAEINLMKEGMAEIGSPFIAEPCDILTIDPDTGELMED